MMLEDLRAKRCANPSCDCEILEGHWNTMDRAQALSMHYGCFCLLSSRQRSFGNDCAVGVELGIDLVDALQNRGGEFDR
jgi:hypothetical protein